MVSLLGQSEVCAFAQPNKSNRTTVKYIGGGFDEQGGPTALINMTRFISMIGLRTSIWQAPCYEESTFNETATSVRIRTQDLVFRKLTIVYVLRRDDVFPAILDLRLHALEKRFYCQSL
jgi:hypothetical protein